MSVYVATTNEIGATFTPPHGDLKTNEEDHHKVIYFDVLLLFTQCEGTKMSGHLLLHLKQIFRSNYKVQS